MTRVRSSVLAAVALLFTSTASADLRVFDVEPQHREEVFAALSDILTPDPSRGLIMEAHGRVEVLPSGQILVNADAKTLEQVGQVLAAMRARSAAAAPRAALRYWAVLGMTPSDATRGGQVRVEVAPNLGGAPFEPTPPVLDSVLAEFRQVVHGDLMFRVLGSAALATNSGQFGEVDGWPLSVEQTVYVQDDTLNASISMELTGPAPNTVGNSRLGNLSVRTTLRRGEFVVLGEGHVQFASGERGPVFYIVHWEG
jgi:hypothetical protein